MPRAARQTTWSSYAGNKEQVPRGVPRDALLDEATIFPQAGQTCVNLVLRQAEGFDTEPARLEARCNADGVKGRGQVTQELAAGARDYPFDGRPPMLRVRAADGAWLNVPIGAVSEGLFRVIERPFQVCCPLTASRVFRLQLQGPRRYSEALRTDFTWKLR